MSDNLVGQIMDFIGERSGNVYWPKAHIYDATNAALMWAWIDCCHTQSMDPIKLSTSTTLSDLSSMRNVMIPKKILGILGDVWVSNQQNMEREDKWWRGDGRDVPRVVVNVSNEKLRPWPQPDKDYSYDVYGVSWPPEVSVINEDVVMDEVLKHAVAALAASMLVEDTHPELADALINEYEEHKQQFMVSWRNRGEGAIINLRPAGKRQRPFGGVVRFTRMLQ